MFGTVGQRYRILLKRMLERSPFRRREPVYRVGKYIADYSALSEEEIQAIAPDVEEIFRNSVSVNRRDGRGQAS
jgi:TPP-dependent pyruvate/acetoin dehydrogenase alpha subunit